MDNILSMMQNIIKLQNNIIKEFDNIKDELYYDTDLSKNNKNKMQININIDNIEKIEKYHFQLWLFTINSYKILEKTKNQMKFIKNYSEFIRCKINKVPKINNNSKFIDIIKEEYLHSNKDHLKQLLVPNNISFKDIINQNNLSTLVKTEYDDSLYNYSIQKKVELTNFASVKINIINKLENINSIFNWFDGNNKYSKGIYMSLCDNFIIKVPFPDLISKNSMNFKHKSIPCKHKDIKICNEKQNELSKKYGSPVRTCNFVHLGEKFIKIGSDYRCPNIPSFGSHNSLIKDIDNVSLQDIKWILMNATSDLLLILLWYEKHKYMGQIVFSDLDIL